MIARLLAALRTDHRCRYPHGCDRPAGADQLFCKPHRFADRHAARARTTGRTGRHRSAA